MCTQILLCPEYYSLFNNGFHGVIQRPMLALIFNHLTICKTYGKTQCNKLSSVSSLVYKDHVNYCCKHRYIQQVGVNSNIIQDVQPKSH